LIDNEADAAVDVHQAACQPLQSELREVEEEIVNAMAARKPVDPALEDRRRELMADIEHQNTLLSDAVARVDRLRKPLAQEIQALERTYVPRQTLEFGLNREGVAHPDLLDQGWALDELSKLLGSAITAAKKRIGELRPMHIRNPNKFERRYELLVDKLTILNNEVRSELDENLKAIVAE
jgi:hypothetical protein